MPLQVHGTPATFTESSGEAKNFGEGFVQHGGNVWSDKLLKVEAVRGNIAERFCEKLVMTAVGSIDGVARTQAHCGTDSATFLSDRRVRRPVNKAFAGKLKHCFLKRTNQVQLTEHGSEQCGVGASPVFLGGLDLNPRLGRLKRGICSHDGFSSLR
jgi:hypothetical protein